MERFLRAVVRRLWVICGVGLLIVACNRDGVSVGQSSAPTIVPAAHPRSPGATDAMVAVGALSSPRGIVIGADSGLYVADAGSASMPYAGRIVQVAPDGTSETLLAGFSNAAEEHGHTYITGISDVAASGDTVYIVLGVTAWLESPLYGPNRVLRISGGGELTDVLDVGLFEQERDPDRQGPDSNASGVAVAPDNTLWVTDAAGNWVAHVAADGSVLTVVAFPQVNGEQAVPTGVAVGPDGNAYVALFRCQEPTQGKGGVARVKPDGTYDIVASGLSNPIDVAFDGHGNLYVLEFSVDYAPATGSLVRMDEDGAPTVVIDGLTYPTSVAFAPDGSVFITEISAVSSGEAGTGKLLRFDRP